MLFGEHMTQLLALHHPESPLFQPIQIATHFFMHGNFMHLAFNMFGLIILGPILEQIWGHKQFLLYFFVCAIGASVIYMLHLTWKITALQEAMYAFKETSTLVDFQRFIDALGFGPEQINMDVINQMSRGMTPEYIGLANEFINEYYYKVLNTTVLGASGAVYGLLAAIGLIFPNHDLKILFLPITIKAKHLVMGLLAYGLYQGLFPSFGDNTAHFAHLGGAITGFFLILYWRKFGNG
ncbi:MAG: rhomboid family intramembrane serine protease [Lewinella sp.]|uniref:rhomboid family intramembrane serine protease n=1 Tax=Lewinella sp. TaxID=2004506 RepID=UPI003D6C6625